MSETNKLHRLEEIAQAHDFKDVLQAIEKARRQDKVTVGFIGPFTSKRVSLVNAMFGTAFPELRDEPLSAIVRVEEGAADEACLYFQESKDGRRKLNEEELPSLLSNEKTEGSLVAQVSGNDLLKKCCVVVFPGFGRSEDVDARVVGSLALVDYFCYSFSTNLTDDDLSMIANPLISSCPRCVDFLMTRDCHRDQTRADAIFADAIKNVAELPAFKEIDVEGVFAKACPGDADAVGKYLTKLSMRLDEMRETMAAARSEKTADAVCEILKKAIQRRSEFLTLPPEDISGEKQKYYELIQVAQREENDLLERFDVVGARIGLVLKNKFNELKWDFMAAVEPSDRAEIIRGFLQETMGAVVADEYRREFGQIDEKDLERTIDRTDVMKALNELNSKTKRATQVADFFNVVGTAALMTLGPATGGGNLVEGIAGAFLGSKTDEHIFGSLRKFNPVVMATDFAADLYREKAFDEYADKMQGLGVAIGRKTYAFIDELYLKPKQLQIVVAEGEIKQIEDERRKGMLDAALEMRALDADFKELEAMA